MGNRKTHDPEWDPSSHVLLLSLILGSQPTITPLLAHHIVVHGSDKDFIMETALGGASPRDVFVLGAGFSKAVSSEFPLTDELGNTAIKRLLKDTLERSSSTIPHGDFSEGTFESWLGQLAEDHHTFPRQPTCAIAPCL